MAGSGADGMVLTETEALELIAFLTSSAEISLREPNHYGTLRLIDAVSRMIGFMLPHQPPRSAEFLRELKAEIDVKKLWAMWDQPAYFDFLRETPGKVAAEVVRLETSTTAEEPA